MRDLGATSSTLSIASSIAAPGPSRQWPSNVSPLRLDLSKCEYLQGTPVNSGSSESFHAELFSPGVIFEMEIVREAPEGLAGSKIRSETTD